MSQYARLTMPRQDVDEQTPFRLKYATDFEGVVTLARDVLDDDVIALAVLAFNDIDDFKLGMCCD